MAIESSAILPSDSLEEFRVQFNLLITDVDGIAGGNTFVSSIIFEGATADTNETTILATDPTADRTLTLPDVSGTFITTGNVDAISAAGTTTTSAADADHVLVNDGGVLKKITRANLGIGGTAGAVAADDLTAGDAAVTIATTAGNITFDAQGSNTDIIFKGTDGGADITPMTLDMSAGGDLFLTGGLIDLKNDGSAVSQIKFYCESSNAHAQTLIGAPHSETASNTLTLPSTGGSSKLLSATSTATVTNKTLTSPVINTATVGTSITPASDDGATLGTANLNWSDLFIADAGLIKFGDDQDVTLTHVHNVGLTLTHVATGDNTPIVLQLKSEEDAIVASEVIASLEFAAGDTDGTDGATVAAGIHAIAEGTFTGSANATKLVFTTGVSETAAASATAKMTLSSAGLLTIADDFMIKDGGTIGVASTNDAITISSAGIVTFKDDILVKDDGTIGSASAATAMTISSAGIVTFVDDILIKNGGTIGSASAATAITIASTGIVTFVDDIILKDAATIGVTSSTGAISIASTGIVTLVDDLLLKDACTIGTATTAGAIAIAADGTVDLDTAGATVASAVIKTVGKESIWVPSSAMQPTTTNGCSTLTTVETTSGRPDMVVLDFDKDSDEFAQFSVAFPKSYNLGTVTFQYFWSGLAATTGVELTLAGVAMNDNETIDVAYGTAVAVADAAQGAVEELLVSAESGAVTIAGTMADNDLAYFRIGRDVSEDNMAGDCRLHGIKLHFTTDAANDG